MVGAAGHGVHAGGPGGSIANHLGAHTVAHGLEHAALVFAARLVRAALEDLAGRDTVGLAGPERPAAQASVAGALASHPSSGDLRRRKLLHPALEGPTRAGGVGQRTDVGIANGRGLQEERAHGPGRHVPAELEREGLKEHDDPGDLRRCRRGACELGGVEGVAVARVEEVSVAQRDGFGAVGLSVAAAPEVGEVHRARRRTVVATGRRARADHDRTRVAHLAIETAFVERVVQVLEAIPRGLDDGDAQVPREHDGVEVHPVELDGHHAELTARVGVDVVLGAFALLLQKDHVPGAQPLEGPRDGRADPPGVLERERREEVGLRRGCDAVDALTVVGRADHAQGGGAVVRALDRGVERRADARAPEGALPGRDLAVQRVEVALDVHDGAPLAKATETAPELGDGQSEGRFFSQVGLLVGEPRQRHLRAVERRRALGLLDARVRPERGLDRGRGGGERAFQHDLATPREVGRRSTGAPLGFVLESAQRWSRQSVTIDDPRTGGQPAEERAFVDPRPRPHTHAGLVLSLCARFADPQGQAEERPGACAHALDHGAFCRAAASSSATTASSSGPWR